MSHEQPKDEAAPEAVERSARKVIIEVLGGVAYVASQPDDVEVEIIDYDNVNEMECDGVNRPVLPA